MAKSRKSGLAFDVRDYPDSAAEYRRGTEKHQCVITERYPKAISDMEKKK